MFRFSAYLTLVVVLSAVLTGCQNAPPPEALPAAATTEDTAAKVLQLLSVNTDGTVAITDEAKAKALIGSSWPAAKAELVTLNQRIRSGAVPAFHSQADLASYTRRTPVYQTSLDETGEANFTEAFSDPKNPLCRDECNKLTEMCCCGGFWFLCWATCGCKP